VRASEKLTLQARAKTIPSESRGLAEARALGEEKPPRKARKFTQKIRAQRMVRMRLGEDCEHLAIQIEVSLSLSHLI